MSEPIRITIAFDSAGRPIIREAISDLNTLAASARQNTATYAAGGRALRQFESDVNRVSSALQGRLSSSIGVAASGFTNLIRLAESLGRTGFYTMIGGATAATYALTKMGRGFLDINEQFQNLETTLRSTFKNLSIARELRNELVKITAISPIPFTQLADVARTFSVLPQTRGAIALQTAKGTLGDADGFFRKAEKLVEQMIAFRPDKTAEDAIFSIREALSGQFRSLVRRFDIPLRYLAQAGGTTSDKLKNDSGATFEALVKMFSNIISPAAIREYTKQPTVLFRNLKEQLLEIPALLVGGNGKEGIYTTLLTKINGVYEVLVNFVSTRIQPYATRISKSLETVLSTFGKMGSGITEFFLHKMNLGQADSPDKNLADRLAEGITQLIEKGTAALPNFLGRVGSFFKTLLPILETFAKAVIKIIDIFANHPIASLLAYSQIGTIPALVRGTLGGGVSRLGSLTTMGQTGAALNPTASSIADGFTLALRNAQIRQGAFSGAGAIGSLFNNSQYSTAQGASLAPLLQQTATGRFRIPVSGLTPAQLAALNIPSGTTGRPFVSNAVAGGLFSAAGTAAARAGVGGALGGAAMGAAGLFSSVIVPMIAMAAITWSVVKVFEKMEESATLAANAMRSIVQAGRPGETAQEDRHQSVIQFAENLKSAQERGLKLPAMDLPMSGMTMYHGKAYNLNQFVSGQSAVGKGDVKSVIEQFIALNSQLDTINNQISGGTGSANQIRQWGNEAKSLEEQISLYNKSINSYFKRLGTVFPEVNTDKQQKWQYEAKELVDNLLDRERVIGNHFKNSLGKASEIMAAIPVEGVLPFVDEITKFSEASKKKLTPAGNLKEDLSAIGKALDTIVGLGTDLSSLTSRPDFGTNLEKGKNSYASAYATAIKAVGMTSTLGGEPSANVQARLKEEFNNIDSIGTKYLESIATTLKDNRVLFEDIANQSVFFRLVKDILPQIESATSREEGQRLTSEFLSSTKGALSAFKELPASLASGIDQIAKDLLNITPDKTHKQLADDFEMARVAQAKADLFHNYAKHLGQEIEDMTTELYTRFPGLDNSPEGLMAKHLLDEKIGLKTGVENTGAALQGQADTLNKAGVNRENTQLTDIYNTSVERLMKDLLMLQNDKSSNMVLKQLRESLQGIGDPELADRIAQVSDVLKLDSDNDLLNLIQKIQVVNPLLEDLAAKTLKAADAALAAKQTTDYGQLMAKAEAYFKLIDQNTHKLDSIQGKGGPLGSLVDGWQTTMDNYKAVATNFADIGKGVAESISSSFGQAFDSIITNSKSAGDAFKEMGLNMLRTIANLLAKKAIEGLLGYLFTLWSPAAGAVAGTGLSFAGDQSMAGYATTKWATGGRIRGGSGTRDDVPIMAMGGEYVVQKSAVQKYGTHFLDMLNSGYMPKFADGGWVSNPTPSFSPAMRPRPGSAPNSAGSMGGDNYHFNVVINDGASSGLSSSGIGPKGLDVDSISKVIRASVVQEIQRQQRIGGSLRK